MGFRNRDVEERIVLIEPEGGGGGFGWFVLGAALGAGLGLLFAPRSGARTRKALGRRLTNLKEQAEEGLESLAGGLEQGAERLAKRVDRWAADEDDDEETVAAADDRESDEAAEDDDDGDEEEAELSPREELERRLQQARARRRRRDPDEAEEEPVA